jgi:hypothetical protein
MRSAAAFADECLWSVRHQAGVISSASSTACELSGNGINSPPN